MTDADPTIELDSTPLTPPPIDVIEVAPPSRWPAAVDVTAKYAAIGVASTGRRLEWWLTTHKDAHHLAELEVAGPDYRDQYLAERSRQRWVLAIRWVLLAVLVATGAGIGVWQIGRHGMWPLFIGTTALVGWYSAKGWALTRWAWLREHSGLRIRHRPAAADGVVPGERVNVGPARILRDVLDVDFEQPPELIGDDSDPTIRLFRRHRHAAQPSEPMGERRPAGPPPPGWLNQVTIEGKLKAAHKPLRHSRPGDNGLVVELVANRHMGNGWAFTITLPEDVTALEVCKQRERVARVFHVDETCLMMFPGEHGGILTVWVCDTDPLGGPPTMARLIDAGELNAWDGFLLGRTIDTGEEVLFNPIGTHLLVTGGTGSGKSEFVNALVARLSLDPHHQLVFIDPDGVEWAHYSKIGRHFSGVDGMEAAAKFIEDLAERGLKRRAERLADYRRRFPARMPNFKLYDFIARDPAEDMAPITIVVGESASLFREDNASDWYRWFSAIIEKGRKYGVSLIFETQIASGEKLKGTGIRNLFTTRLCGSVETVAEARMALGDGYAKTGMDPLAIQPYRHAGAFYLKGAALRSPDRTWVLFKAHMVDGTESGYVLDRALDLRRRVRPGLLSVVERSASSTPERHTEPPLGTQEPPLDLEPLRRIVAVLERLGGGTVLASAVIAELANTHPVEHGNVATVNALNNLLAPYVLRTKQPTMPDGTRPHQLMYGPCVHRLAELERRSEQPPERPDGP